MSKSIQKPFTSSNLSIQKTTQVSALAESLRDLFVESGLPQALETKRRVELLSTWTVPSAAIRAACEAERELRVGGFDVAAAEHTLEVERRVLPMLRVLVALTQRVEDWLLVMRAASAKQTLALYDAMPGIVRLRGGQEIHRLLLEDFRGTFRFPGRRPSEELTPEPSPEPVPVPSPMPAE